MMGMLKAKAQATDVVRQPEESDIQVRSGMNMILPMAAADAKTPPARPACFVNSLRDATCRGTTWVILTASAINKP